MWYIIHDIKLFGCINYLYDINKITKIKILQHWKINFLDNLIGVNHFTLSYQMLYYLKNI